MNATTVIPTDLVTPLGAYLRLRPEDGAAFLLESVEHGRLGRHSFVGYGSRIVGFEEAEAVDEPVVGYLGYDHIARLEPTVPLPETGPDLPESQFVVADTLVKFDHVLGMAEILRGDPVEVAERLDGPLSRLEAGRNGTAGGRGASPGRFEYVRGVERAKQYIREGDAFQIVLSQRAERATRASAVDLYRSLRRVNPSPYLFLLELERARARRLLAGDARQGRGRPREREPDRRHDPARAGRRREAPRLREGPRGARDARRPRPERPLARLPAGDGSRRALPRAGALLARHPPRLRGRRRAPAGREPVRPAARLLPGRHGLGRAEGARDADHLGARGVPARRRTRGAVGYSLPGGALDTCIAIRTMVLSDGVAHLQAGAGIVADSVPALEHDECLKKLAAIERAIELAEARL